MRKGTSFIFFILFIAFNLFSQKEEKIKYSKESLSDLISEYYTVEDSLLRRRIASEILRFAYQEKDTSKILTGYFLLANSSRSFNKGRIADSIIKYGTLNPGKNYPGIGYLIKGDYFFKENRFKIALNNYIKAYAFSKSNDNPDLTHTISFNIGVLKIRAGDFDEAKKILLEYFKKEKTQRANRQFLQGCYALADVYNRLSIIDSSRYYQRIGMNRAKSLQDTEMIAYLRLAESQSDHKEAKYQESIAKSEMVLAYFTDKGDNILLAEIFNIIGQNYWQLDQKKKAVDYFKKVDEIFNIENDLFPSEREAFTKLLHYYEGEDELKNRFYYINQTLKLDSIIYSNSNYLKSNIYSDYTTDQLLAQKDKIVVELKSKNRIKILIIGGLIFVIIGFAGWIVSLINNAAKNKKAYEKIISNDQSTKVVETAVKNSNTAIISEEIISDILLKLKTFEIEKGFLNSNLTLQKLSKTMRTNTKYLSVVINENKGTSFTNYLNDLRIEYAISRLKTDRKFRNYTIKAIALESGFNNSESFSRVFKSKTELRPSYFLKKINKEGLDKK